MTVLNQVRSALRHGRTRTHVCCWNGQPNEPCTATYRQKTKSVSNISSLLCNRIINAPHWLSGSQYFSMYLDFPLFFYITLLYASTFCGAGVIKNFPKALAAGSSLQWFAFFYISLCHVHRFRPGASNTSFFEFWCLRCC